MDASKVTTDNELQLIKLPAVPRGVKSKWPCVGTRLPIADQVLIDKAADELGIDRSELIYDAVIRRAREVLGIAA